MFDRYQLRTSTWHPQDKHPKTYAKHPRLEQATPHAKVVAQRICIDPDDLCYLLGRYGGYGDTIVAHVGENQSA